MGPEVMEIRIPDLTPAKNGLESLHKRALEDVNSATGHIHKKDDKTKGNCRFYLRQILVFFPHCLISD